MEQVHIVMFDNGKNYGHVIIYIVDIYASLDDAQQRANQLTNQLIEEDKVDYEGWNPYYVTSRDVFAPGEGNRIESSV